MTNELSLVGKVIALHRALDDAGVAHAFGGAIALAYYSEPRATKDIDVNVAVEPFETDRLLAALPAGVETIGDERETAERDGQLRLWWGATPIDLFLGFHEFHRQLAENARLVPFADTSIPVIDGADLVVCKAMFDRSKDWVDIESMARDGRTDFTRSTRWLTELLGPEAPQLDRLTAIVAAAVRETSRPAVDPASRLDPP